jgi:hypothetical protein
MQQQGISSDTARYQIWQEKENALRQKMDLMRAERKKLHLRSSLTLQPAGDGPLLGGFFVAKALGVGGEPFRRDPDKTQTREALELA